MATLGKGVEYALHCMLPLVNPPDGAVITLADLAAYQGVSESYLAKVFTRLTKAGLVRSAVGAHGGYELARPADRISFWDVVLAVEGGFRLFDCHNVREGCVLYRNEVEKPAWLVSGTCQIHGVMLEAEARVKAELESRTLAWLVQAVDRKIPKSEVEATLRWFRNASASRG